MRVVIFGSSARRGSTGWTDDQRIASFFATACPDVVIEGESPAGGADRLARIAAESLGIHVDPCPVDTTIDGPWPAAGHRRNERMHRTKRPDVAAGFISGKVGTPLSSGSAGMARICEAAGTPLVVYRENGIDLPTPTDPDCRGDRMAGDLWYARRMLRGLVKFAREDVIAAGMAVAAAHDRVRERAATREVVPLVAAAWNAVEVLRGRQPRLGPWIEVVEGLVKRNA